MTRSQGLSTGALALGLTVAGCSPAAPAHSTAWYSEHSKAALARLEVCDRLSIPERDADCLNAQQGALLAAMHGPSTVQPYK